LWALLPLAGLAQGALAWGTLARFILVAVALGLGYEVAARSIPFERHARFWLRVTPARATTFCLARLAGSSVLAGTAVALVALVLLTIQPGRPGTVLQAAGLAAMALPLSQSIGLWAGVRFGDADWVNPRAMLRLTGRLAASGLTIAQLGAWMAFGSLLDHASGAWKLALFPIGLLGSGLLSLLPIRAAAKLVSGSDSAD
jgi:hypothetical protein